MVGGMRAVGSVEDDRREPESDLTLLCLRLAEGFRLDEYEHPVAAAVAVAARGITGLGQMKFAERFGSSEADVTRVCDGQPHANKRYERELTLLRN